MNSRFCLLGVVLSYLLVVANAQASLVVYDGSLGTSPAAQGYFTYGAVPSGTFYTQGSSNLTLDSTSNINIHSGFSNYNATLTGLQNAAFPTLDRATGFTVSVNMQTLSETHNSGSSRAGFSLIALSSDHQGIEIGFWPDEIFAQTSTFTQIQGQTVTYDTTAAMQEYDLTIQGSMYTLSTGTSVLLTGGIQDYSGYGAVPNVYALPNFVFFGDDTTEASGQTLVSRLTVAIPEPASASLLLTLGLPLLGRRRILASKIR